MLKGVSRLILKAVVAIAALCASMFAQGGWTDDGSVVRLTTNSDIVGLGLWSPGYSFPSAGQVKLHVDGGQFTEGLVDWRLWVSNTSTLQTPNGAGVGIKFQHGNSTSWDSTKWAGVAGVAEAGNSNYIGLAFYTHTDGQTTQSTAERMRITGTGRVGIGINNPGYGFDCAGQVKLHVGDSQFVQGKVDWRLWVSDTGTLPDPQGAGVGIKFQHGRNTQWDSVKWAGIAGVAEYAYSNYVGLAFYTHTDASSPAERMRITGTGSVCIGTANAPGANGKLLVKGGAVIGYSAAGTNPPDSGLVVRGAVRIGTTSTDTFKLTVNGTIRAKGIVVNTGWSDFVFKKGYTLKPIVEVEKFIKTNNHLEGIPTAKEVRKNGVSIGDMQAKLLQKVEELTLYLIDQNRKIEMLTRDNTELKAKLGKQ